MIFNVVGPDKGVRAIEADSPVAAVEQVLESPLPPPPVSTWDEETRTITFSTPLGPISVAVPDEPPADVWERLLAEETVPVVLAVHNGMVVNGQLALIPTAYRVPVSVLAQVTELLVPYEAI